MSVNNNPKTHIEKLNNSIFEIFNFINNNEVNIYERLVNLKKNFENALKENQKEENQKEENQKEENKKTKSKQYEDVLNDYIQTINPPNSNQTKEEKDQRLKENSAIFNEFCNEHLKITIPSRNQFGRKKSTSNLSEVVKNEKKYFFKYMNEGGKEFDIPFEFQTIIAYDENILNNDHKKKLLIFVNIIRKYYVDRLLEILTTYFFEKCNKKLSLDFSCSVVAVGTVSVTSNYNVTVSGVFYPNQIVNEFNYHFEEFWNNFSSEVFDTNIYGSTFFVTLPKGLPINNTRNRIINNGYSKIKDTNILYLPPKSFTITTEKGLKNDQTYTTLLEKINISQFKWLVTKVHLHMKEYGIPVNNKNLNNIIKLLYKIINKTNNLNEEKIYEFIQNIYNEKFNTDYEIIIPDLPIENSFNNTNNANNAPIMGGDPVSNKIYTKKNLNNYGKSVQNKIQSELTESSKRGNISSSIIQNKMKEIEYKQYRRTMYQKTLDEIKATQLGYELSISESHHIQSLKFLERLIDTISKSNFYGSETYLCMGTIYHILGYIQNLGAFEMKKEYFQQSAIENYMDMFRYYEKMEKDQEYAIIKMSKYAYRVYHSLSILETFGSNGTFNKNVNKYTNNIYKDKLGIFKDILKELKGYHSFDSRKDLKNKLYVLFVKSKSTKQSSNSQVLNSSTLNSNNPSTNNPSTNSSTSNNPSTNSSTSNSSTSNSSTSNINGQKPVLALSEPQNNGSLETRSENENIKINNNELLTSILNKMFEDIESTLLKKIR